MKQIINLFILLSINFLSSQNNINSNTSQKNKIFEDQSGKIVSEPEQIKIILEKKKLETTINTSKLKFRSSSAVHLCSNNNFEEFETIGGTNYLKDYKYTLTDPLNPTQCVTPVVNATSGILEYNPTNTNLMATTVPSNYIDEFIGNINAFDQFALKINYKGSNTTSGVVQAKRFKTNNEDKVIFNYKAVLQSINESGHQNEQPFIKIRIIKNNGSIADEFCLIGDPTNCIFTQAPNYVAGSIVLFTPNWQNVSLDISSIPNNEEFIIEMTAARCGLGGHFGYAYIDDLCLAHSDENLQGNIELNPLFQICPNSTIDVCGTFTIPNSGGISASVSSITLNILNNTNAVVYSSSTPTLLDLNTKTFCFQLNSANFPNTTNANYNISVTINYNTTQTNCIGTAFNSATDPDANIGWDVSFLNCIPDCNFSIQSGTLKMCDTNSDGKEFFNLTNIENQLIGTQTGLTISYFNTYNDASTNTNSITNPTNFESYSSTLYARITKDATCYKIIAFQLLVKNPFASISGILNVCQGSTNLTASQGVSYLWSTGETTQTINVTSVGTYSVTVIDNDGCSSSKSVTILPSQVAVSPTIEVIQPTCSIGTGTITITSPAAEFSIDGGTTWSTSNTFSNLNVGFYDVKIRTINNCYSYNSTVHIIPFLSDYPYFNSIQPSSCDGLGEITITTVASEYSFDNGITWTTNNVATNLPMGTYLIRTKDINGCISNFNSVILYGEFLSNPTYVFSPPYCSNLGSIIFTTISDFYSIDGGTTWQTSNTFNNLAAGSYLVKIKNNLGCTSPSQYVYLTSLENTSPNYTIIDAGCNTYASIIVNTIADEYSFDNGITWSTSNTLSNIYGGGVTYPIKIRKGGNCYSLTSNAYVSSSFLPLPVVSNYSILICDNQNNGNEPVNLTTYNNQLVINSTNYTFNYYNSLSGAQNQTLTDQILNPLNYLLNSNSKIIYVNVKDNFGCYSVAELQLDLIATPIPTINELFYLCENQTVNLSENEHFDSYLWSTGETSSSIIVNQPGQYLLTVTENHGNVICSTSKTINVVLSNPAIFQQTITSDWTDDNNTITVTVTGLGDYEYSLNGADFQNSNVFTNLEYGEYTIYVRDKHGCGISTDEIYLLMYPKYFTPNGDGYNDFWKIKFSDNEPNLTIKIFDRQGKLVKQFGSLSVGWDGNYNGAPLPSTDYWFEVTRENGKTHKGHFSLKR